MQDYIKLKSFFPAKGAIDKVKMEYIQKKAIHGVGENICKAYIIYVDNL